MTDEYETPDDDLGERTVSELENVQSTLEEIHSELREIRSAINSKTDAFGLVWLALVILFASNWSGSKPDRFTDRIWYSMNYNTDWKNVDIQKRPTDCDFLRAPIGSKPCSYNKNKSVFGANERQTLSAQAPTAEDKNAVEKTPNSVTVYWEKKDEP